jgi:hypothetical protein
LKLLEYKHQISQADTAAELHELRGTAEFDPQLSPAQKQAVADAVGRRFAELNTQAIGKQKPRWQARRLTPSL